MAEDPAKKRARQARYDSTEKGRARHCRYEQTRIRLGVGGLRFTYRVPAEQKMDLMERLAEFRAGQTAEYRDYTERLDPSRRNTVRVGRPARG